MSRQSRKGGGFYSPETRLVGRSVWNTLFFVFNGALFILLGLQLRSIFEELAIFPAATLAQYALAISATPGVAQVDSSIVLNIMRECAKIDDPTARLACYDNNIRAAGANPRSVPGQAARPSGGGAVVNPNAPGGFGADDLRSQSPERFDR